MKKLAEMRSSFPMELHGGVMSTTSDVWAILTAAKEGDLNKIKSLGSKCRALLWCQYDYTTPMQFAVREGHFEVVQYLVENSGLDAEDRNHPFLETLLTLAEDRGHEEIAGLLTNSLANKERFHTRGDTGKIDHGRDKEQIHFQAVVDRNDINEAKSMLNVLPELAKDELAFWGEGILSVPCNRPDYPTIELLLVHGATVPEVSKWGARYYFKHYEISRLLLESGMDANHSNWREFSLLHDMCFTGDVEKAKLLLDHGAKIDAIDEEYYSTPLGYAAHFGHFELVNLLLESGADPDHAGKPWATPIAWSRKKGRLEIESNYSMQVRGRWICSERNRFR